MIIKKASYEKAFFLAQTILANYLRKFTHHNIKSKQVKPGYLYVYIG